MRKVATKALYLFLCSILGMVLFAMLHRAIFVLYDLVLIFDYETYSFGMNQAMILALDFFTMLIALFLGGWYGTLLGIDWYSMVYGVNAETKAGVFHGFLPHNWRKGARKSSTKSIVSKPAPVKAAPAPAPKTVSVPVTSSAAWDFDEFLKATPVPKKRTAATPKVAKKPAAKKTVRKTTKRAVKVVAE